MVRRDEPLHIKMTRGERVRCEYVASQMGVSMGGLFRWLLAEEIIRRGWEEREEVKASVKLDRG